MTANNPNANVAVYVRESRDENEENFDTIETQRDLLIKYTQENKLGTVYKVYMDDNVSGTTFERPAIKELEEDIAQGKIDILVVKDLSRLGRNNAKTLVFLDYLEENGVRVISTDGRFDSSNDGDLVGIETWFNERYAKDISRKIRTNLKFKISRGEFLGKAPYGYTKSESKKNTLQINPEQAEVVRQIYKLYIDGFGYSKIAKFLNEKNILSPSEAKGIINYTQKWSNIAIQRILCSQVYIGETVQGVSEKISFKSKKTRRLPQERWVVTADTHESIIDKETFRKAQEIRNSKKKSFSGTNKGTVNSFTGMIYCGLCKNPMFSRKRKDGNSGYICREYAKYGKSKCTSHFVRESYILKAIAEELSDFLNNESVLEEIDCVLTNESWYNNSEKIRQKMLKEIEKYKYKQEKIYTDMLEGLITKDLFIRMNNNIEESIRKKNYDIEKTEHIERERYTAKSVLTEIIKLCNENKLPYQLSRIIIKRITIFDPGECLQTDITGENIQMSETEGIILVEFNF